MYRVIKSQITIYWDTTHVYIDLVNNGIFQHRAVNFIEKYQHIHLKKDEIAVITRSG